MNQDDLQLLRQTYYSLYRSLRDTYWAASTLEAKDEIQGAQDIVNGVLDALIHADLQTDNAAIAKFTDDLKASVKDIGDLQLRLNKIVHNVTVASTAIDSITKALTVAGKLIA